MTSTVKCENPGCESTRFEQSPDGDSCTTCGTILPSSTVFESLGRSSTVIDPTSLLSNGRTVLLGEGIAPPKGKDGEVVNENQDYHKKRMNETKHEIKAILRQIELPSLTQRAIFIFEQAKLIGKFKWGTTAKAMATASVFIAAREQSKELNLQTLSALKEIEQHVLSAAELSIKSWLNISTEDQDPIIFLDKHLVYFSQLQKLANPVLSGSKNKKTWSASNLKWLRSLDLKSVKVLATGVAAFSRDLSIVVGREPESVSCALIIIAMEGVARRPCPVVGDILGEMNAQFQVSPHTVGERIREIHLAIVDFAPNIPWIGEVSGLSKKEMSKHIDDIVTFRVLGEKKVKKVQEALLLQEKKILAEPMYTGDISMKDGNQVVSNIESEDDNEDGITSDEPSSKNSTPIPFDESSNQTEPERRPKIGAAKKRPIEYMRSSAGKEKRVKTIETATATLANFPFALPTSLEPASTAAIIAPPSTNFRRATFAAHSEEAINFTAQLLSGQSPFEVNEGKAEALEDQDARYSSRLYRLLWTKKCDEITDEELFGDGELNGFFRDEEEKNALKESPKYLEMMAHVVSEPRPPRKNKEKEDAEKKKKEKRSKKSGSVSEEVEEVEEPRKSKRIDYAKLALALDSTGVDDEAGGEELGDLYKEFEEDEV